MLSKPNDYNIIGTVTIMNNNREVNQKRGLRLPLGFFDKTGENLRRQRVVEGIFRKEGTSRGYQEIETPILECSETLPPELFSCWKKQGFIRLNLPDYDGQLRKVSSAEVILRPEGTIPICRWLATQISSHQNKFLPVKLIYSIDCYRNEPIEELSDHKRRQFNQLGVESIGDATLEADREVIEYAYRVMEKVGIKKADMRIRLNNIQLFKRLCDNSGFNGKKRYTLQEKIDGFSKARALGRVDRLDLTETARLNANLRAQWELLLNTYDPSPKGLDGIDQCLSEFRRDLNGLPIVIDTSVVRGFSYYTGPVFQIDVRKGSQWVAEIGGGGRYDDLIGQNLKTFGIDLNVPATGFAFGTERLVQSSRLPNGTYNLRVTI